MSEKGPPNRPPSTPEELASRTTLRPPHSAVETPDFAKLVPKRGSAVQVPLGRLETTVFMRIDGRRSVSEISAEVGLAPYEVLRILERLLQLVPDLTLGQSEVVELSVDELWEEGPGPNERTAEHEVPTGLPPVGDDD
ncbi:MAG: AsnC family protein [Polyangiales bacterium]